MQERSALQVTSGTALLKLAAMEPQVLIIDDDRELCALLSDFLSLEGFEIHAVHDGAEAVDHCREHSYDAIVLDVMLPRIQGFDVLRQLREFSRTPVIMLTARGEDTDRIVGLEMGADDYLPKPCNPRELAARLRAILRRVEPGQREKASEVLKRDELVLHRGDRSVEQAGEPVKLTTAEFNILAVLLEHAGDVVAKETLTEQALGRALTAYDRSVDVHVSNLRKKLGFTGDADRIVNIRGIGYQFTVNRHDAPT